MIEVVFIESRSVEFMDLDMGGERLDAPDVIERIVRGTVRLVRFVEQSIPHYGPFGEHKGPPETIAIHYYLDGELTGLRYAMGSPFRHVAYPAACVVTPPRAGIECRDYFREAGR